ncbi:hypothetical protein EDD18DRAFT_530430 [Armillaria luteobubalina]|uniref:Uncharacterized protein n=1 Tax=Armillaria luteobubalina TaxID=153913 RepID=A0AA39UJI5_9AGAR|nr:hypothetical protein EDD18DRAFT_530430 [Armillaria luteobubalina]
MPLRRGKVPFWVVFRCFRSSNHNQQYDQASSKLTGKDKDYLIGIIFASEVADTAYDWPFCRRYPVPNISLYSNIVTCLYFSRNETPSHHRYFRAQVALYRIFVGTSFLTSVSYHSFSLSDSCIGYRGSWQRALPSPATLVSLESIHWQLSQRLLALQATVLANIPAIPGTISSSGGWSPDNSGIASRTGAATSFEGSAG